MTTVAMTLGRLLTTAAVAVMVAVVGFGPHPALAQYSADMDMVLSRLGRLENEVLTMGSQLHRSSGASSSASPSNPALAPGQGAADVEVRLSRLERQVQDLTGRVEEAGFAISQMKDKLERMSGDVDFRLSQLEARPGGGSPAAGTGTGTAGKPPAAAPAQASRPIVPPVAHVESPPPPAPIATPAGSRPAAPVALPTGGPQAQYDYAFGLLRKADYDNAELALKAFVEKHRDHALAGNAQYWLAETHFVRGKYNEAAVAYAEGLQKYPKNVNAADNLFKLGMSLSALNRKKDACDAFGQFNSQFPDAAPSIKRRAEQERKRLSCG
ncbi:Cell division coordinator CpoB [uncultured Gammaproteobacteria bacterium]